MIVDISLDCVVSQRPLWGTLGRLPRPISLIFPYSRSVMILLRRPVHSVVSARNDRHFRSIATSSFDRIYPGIIHFVELAVGQIYFLSAVFVEFHSRYQSTLIPVPPSIRPS